MRRVILLVLDSLGTGAAPDAALYGDCGADTLGHIAGACVQGRADTSSRAGALAIPNLTALGLMRAAALSSGSLPSGTDLSVTVTGASGCAGEISCGKDTPAGHWEIAGVPVFETQGTFPRRKASFPQDLLATLVAETGIPGVLGNCHASGTQIIRHLGAEHIRTGKPVVYTSADSVFQIACHEKYFGLQRLYEVCRTARKLLDKYRIGRVIARPFTGELPEEFVRTGNRRDFSLPPPGETLPVKLVHAGAQVCGVGKTADIFAGQGFTRVIRAYGLDALFDATLSAMAQTSDPPALIFTNFTDFDSLYGHRRDVAGYAAALEHFDRRLPELCARLSPEDLLVLTADHGCDPVFPGTEHTREYVPVLFSGPAVQPADLGIRSTFADTGQTIADYLAVPPLAYGRSFKDLLFADVTTTSRAVAGY